MPGFRRTARSAGTWPPGAASRGIKVWVFLGPFLPLLTDTEENLDALFAAVARLPLTHIYHDRVNFRSGVASSLKAMVATRFPELVEEYTWLGADSDEDRAYADQLGARIARLAKRYELSEKLR